MGSSKAAEQRALFNAGPISKHRSAIPVWIKKDRILEKRQALLADRIDQWIDKIARQKEKERSVLDRSGSE